MVEESFSNERKDNQELIDQTKKISITDQLCKKCGSCTMVCPHNILVYDAIKKPFQEYIIKTNVFYVDIVWLFVLLTP